MPRPRNRYRPAAPVVLDPPPAYLREVPSSVLSGRDPDPELFLAALRRRGIYARPTLAEVEAERVRRGFRRGVEIRP